MHAVYGNFPYVLAFVIILTFILLMRAFRSVVLAAKAVVMNLISLGIAFGIVVFIFQQGHGSEAIWGIQATDAVISWIPVMIFAFLFGLSMDYEVFIISRIREIYDETGDTNYAISTGIARTGKLVTSAALVLVFAFFALSTGPGPGHQAVRDRPRRRDPDRRDADPVGARAVVHDACSATRTGGSRRRSRRILFVKDRRRRGVTERPALETD